MDASSPQLCQILRNLREAGQLEELLHEVYYGTTSHGAMHGSKRLADAVEPSDDGFSVISEPAEKKKYVPEQEPMPLSRPMSSAASGYVEETNALPVGIQSLTQWGKTVCELPKVTRLEKSYDELMEQARNDKEMASYLSWVYKSKITSKKADDLRAYLEARHWNPRTHKVESPQQMMYYAGSTMVRRLK